VNAQLSRRLLLQATGALGLLYLAGCQRNAGGLADDAGLSTATPDIPWPDPPSSPVRGSPGSVYYPTPSGPITSGPGGLPPQARPAEPPFVPGIGQGVIPRSQWTRSGVARPGNIYPMNGVKRITIHHDGMDVFTERTFARCAGRIEQIRASHLRRTAKGGGRWADIGYHFIVDPQGRVWEGRSASYQGAHVQDHNENNLGILCLGNFERQSPSREQTAALDRFVASQMRTYSVSLSRVYTHRELNPTECPGRNLQRYMVQTRSRGGGMALAIAELGAPQLLA
jgi:hypothetical protein